MQASEVRTSPWEWRYRGFVSQRICIALWSGTSL